MATRRDLRKREILESGLAVLYRNGYAATGVQEIADACGIPKGSFYNYFKSKEHFALEAIELYSRRLLAVQALALGPALPEDASGSSPVPPGAEAFRPPPSASPRERVLFFFQRLAEYHRKRNAPGQGCLVGNLSQEIGAHSSLVADAVNRFFEEFQRPIVDCLRAPGRAAYGDGDGDGDGEPGLLGAMIVDAYQGALVRMKARRSAAPLLEFVEGLGELLRR